MMNTVFICWILDFHVQMFNARYQSQALWEYFRIKSSFSDLHYLYSICGSGSESTFGVLVDPDHLGFLLPPQSVLHYLICQHTVLIKLLDHFLVKFLLKRPLNDAIQDRKNACLMIYYLSLLEKKNCKKKFKCTVMNCSNCIHSSAFAFLPALSSLPENIHSL